MSTREAFGKICTRVCEEQGWELLPTGVRVRWPDGRRQLVSLELFEFEEEELVRLSTVIGRASELELERLLSALRVNAILAHGALAVQDEDLVMVDTLMLADANHAEIEASIRYLAKTADGYEKTLFDRDEH